MGALKSSSTLKKLSSSSCDESWMKRLQDRTEAASKMSGCSPLPFHSGSLSAALLGWPWPNRLPTFHRMKYRRTFKKIHETIIILTYLLKAVWVVVREIFHGYDGILWNWSRFQRLVCIQMKHLLEEVNKDLQVFKLCLGVFIWHVTWGLVWSGIDCPSCKYNM